MAHKHIDFFERAFVKQLCDTFTGCVLPSFMLFLDGLFATSQTSFFAKGDELFYFFKLVTHWG